MARQGNIDRLLAKGLSPEEAGRLAVQELAALNRGEMGTLSERDLSALEATLLTPEDGAAYHRMVDTYEAVRVLLCEAYVVCLRTESLLDGLTCELERFRASAQIAELSVLCALALQADEDDEDTQEVATPVASRAATSKPEEPRTSGGRTRSELLVLVEQAASISASVLLAYLQVIKEADAVLGVDLARRWPSMPRALDCLSGPRPDEDLLAGVKRAAQRLNALVEAGAENADPAASRLSSFDWEKLEPDESTLTLLRHVVACGMGRVGLGEGWWTKSP